MEIVCPDLESIIVNLLYLNMVFIKLYKDKRWQYGSWLFCGKVRNPNYIQEAVQILSEWDSCWSPEFWMMEFCEAEITALKTVFPGEKTILYWLMKHWI